MVTHETIVGGKVAVKKRRYLSYPGVLTIGNLLFFLVMVVVVDELNRYANLIPTSGALPRIAEFLAYTVGLLAYPLVVILLASRTNDALLVVIMLTFNALLFGYGYAGLLERCKSLQFGMRTMLVAVAVCAIMLSVLRQVSWDHATLRWAALPVTAALLIFAVVRVIRQQGETTGRAASD